MQKHHLADIIEPIVEEQGYETVRIMTLGDSNQTLQIMIENKETEKEITVEDCAKVSRAISVKLDEIDIIENQYTLEVSSPGVDRPLTKPEHFKRFLGYEIKLDSSVSVEGRKHFRGKIKEVTEDNAVILNMNETDYTITFNDITKAKLVLTDELWAEYIKAHKDTQS